MDSIQEKLAAVKDILGIVVKLEKESPIQAASLKDISITILKQVTESLQTRYVPDNLSEIHIVEPIDLIPELPPSPPLTPITDIKEDAPLTVGTTGTNGVKRNFTIWARQLNLPSGHALYYGDTSFKLSYDKKDRAVLTTTTVNTSKKIIGYSPSGVIKAYLKASGCIRQVDGWRMMSMRTEEENLTRISWDGWLIREWDTSINNFRII